MSARRHAVRGFPGCIAVVSPFGAESAVLWHMVAEIDPVTPSASPALVVRRGKRFEETIGYRDRLTARLG